MLDEINLLYIMNHVHSLHHNSVDLWLAGWTPSTNCRRLLVLRHEQAERIPILPWMDDILFQICPFEMPQQVVKSCSMPLHRRPDLFLNGVNVGFRALPAEGYLGTY